MRAILSALTMLSVSACGTVGLEYYNQDTGEGLEPGDNPPYGGDTEINEEDSASDTEPETESDTETETDTDTDTDTNSGGGGGGGGGGSQQHNPELSIVRVVDDPTSMTVTFSLDDDDNDISGGSLSLSVGSMSHSLTIPGDLDTWNQGGNSKVTIDMDHCSIGSSPTVTLRATDTSGRSSGASSHSHTMDTDSIRVDSNSSDDHSDTYTTLGVSGVNLGTLSRPTVLCGNIYQSSNDGTAFTGDLDWLDFSAGFGGSTDFSLTWSSTSDYDLYLLNGNSGDTLAASYTNGNTSPEAFTASTSNGQPYVLLIAGWSGSSGDWQVIID
jgi:hypothetical protein